MDNVWKTIYSSDGMKTAWILFCTAGPIFIVWGLGIFVFSFFSTFSSILFGLFLTATGVVVWRHSAQRVETHPDGVLIVNTWNKTFVPWEMVDNIGVAYKNIVVHSKDGDMVPEPSQWGKLVARDSSLILFDLANGPQRIVEIFLILKNNRAVAMDAVHRDIVSVLSDGKKYYEKN